MSSWILVITTIIVITVVSMVVYALCRSSASCTEDEWNKIKH